MLLPTKHLRPEKSLLTVSSRILRHIVRRITLAELWEAYQKSAGPEERVTFDWFVLALDVLFAFGLITLDSGTLRRRS